ncbi:MAG: 2-hydroxyglutaryl-CoA dehydratase, partial [Lachnospiraceae bacterium]|nr:2-hydroxyglutaryl-CoA dehydratase [Lachnospiraceae bacterium]
NSKRNFNNELIKQKQIQSNANHEFNLTILGFLKEFKKILSKTIELDCLYYGYSANKDLYSGQNVILDLGLTLMKIIDKLNKDQRNLIFEILKLINERSEFDIGTISTKWFRDKNQNEGFSQKFVFMDDDENLLEQFYSPNNGNPLIVAKRALLSIKERYEKAGASLEILGVGSTGYGELLFNKAFKTECHMVETVAHARAAEKYVDGVSFILDIGGQDMKGIWIDQGVITNIVVNEACSSGCGSFLENFAASLHIPVMKIAQTAFDSQAPAELGSRCTVFMNSSIITEQRNGKQPGDIMAGLCRSIINNVFTKVIRISNVQSLGSKIVVQGGTFNNDAVLRAMEQYIGREVTRAPYPGIMGAIGAALLTKERMSGQKIERSFIGMEALRDFSFTQEANQPCPFCANHCKRTIVRFSTGDSWITNNRCERGEILGDPSDQKVKDQLKQKREQKQQTPDLYELRKELLFKEYPVQKLTDDRDITIGLPRVLAYWDNMPFWSTFWRALGFKIRMSPYSTRKIYEDGLQSVTSDTVCFPAKLVHGHLRWLAKHGADRIWMPSVTVVPPENTDKHSESM